MVDEMAWRVMTALQHSLLPPCLHACLPDTLLPGQNFRHERFILLLLLYLFGSIEI